MVGDVLLGSGDHENLCKSNQFSSVQFNSSKASKQISQPIIKEESVLLDRLLFYTALLGQTSTAGDPVQADVHAAKTKQGVPSL